MKTKITRKIKDFIWGGPNKKAKVNWEIMAKLREEEGTGIRDPVITLDVAKIKILQKLITRKRQPWMR